MNGYKIVFSLIFILGLGSVAHAAEGVGSSSANEPLTKKQRWVFEHAITGDKWLPSFWERKLGKSVNVPLDESRDMNSEIIKDYYFPSADITIEANVLLHEIVTVWTGKIDANAPPPPEYKILEDETYYPWKRNVTVELDKAVGQDELQRIAEQIHSQNASGLKRTFIAYYLKGSSHDQMAWAVTNYDPDLKVQILGLTASQLKKAASAPSEGKLLGRWSVTMGVTSISIKDGKPIAKTQFADGSSRIEKLKEHPSKLGRRFDVLEDDYGEYYVVLPDGRLESDDREGVIDVSPALE